MSEPGGNVEQAAYWEGRSSSWIEAEDYTTLVTGPFGRRAMETLALEPGQAVLDVGCGTGPTTVEVGRRVAPGGDVLGVDIAPSMLEVARDRATREGVDNVQFRAGDAQVDDFGVFDAVLSQFGVMFFADPAAAFANLRRSVRPGGRLAFACWQDVLLNEWMFVPGAAVMSVTGQLPPTPPPGAPGPFSLSDASRTEDLLAGAGFGSIEIVPHSDQVVVGEDQVDMVVQSASRVGAVREALEANPDPVFGAEVEAAVRAALVERVQDGQLRLGSAAFVVSAQPL
jgi:SAM-dependent methyltransferase